MFRFRFFIGVLFFFYVWAGVSLAQAEERVREIKIENKAPERRADILKVIHIQEGEVFTYEKIQRAIDDLRKWGVFLKTDVLVKHENKSVTLIFQLEEGLIIRDVTIRGNYPILEKKVRRAIFLSPGDIYDPSKNPEQVARLIQFYEKEGYPNTDVLIQQDERLDQRMVTLKVYIQKNKNYRVGDITILGNTVFPMNRVRNKISTLFGYKPVRLKEDLAKIDKLFRKKNYLRVKTRVKKIELDAINRKAHLTIEIKQGKKIDLLFEGNHHQKTDRLKKALDLSDTGDIDDFELDYAKNQLVTHYRREGYENVQVEVQKRELSSDHVEVTFNIEEGPKRVIKRIRFAGNETYSDDELKTKIQTLEQGIGIKGVFLEEVFKQDLANLKAFYNKNGYLDSDVRESGRVLLPTRDKYNIDVQIEEGEQTLVESIVFPGMHSVNPSDVKQILSLKEKGVYSEDRLKEDRETLWRYYANRGYAYAGIRTTVEELGGHRKKVIYEIQEGPQVRVGKVFIVGNAQTRSKTLLQALKFKEGDLLNIQKVLDARTTLRKLGIFDAITVETIGLKSEEELENLRSNSKTEIVHILLRVQEKKSKVYDATLSYDSDTSFKAKFEFSNLNFLGRGKKLSLKATAGVQLNRGEISYSDPNFLGADWQFLTNAFFQREDRRFFKALQGGGSIAFLKNFSRRLSFLGRYQVTYNDFTESETDFTKLDPGTADNILGKLQLNINYDRRDNFADPHSGIYTIGRLDFGSRFQGGRSQFFKVGFRFGHWWSPTRAFTISNTLRHDTIFEVAGNDVPFQELIFMGGDDTIRGFEQDALLPSGGKVGWIHNLELQLRLFKGFQAVAFVDTGSLTNDYDEINWSTIRHSAGIGLRYTTPVGPIRLDYGFILDRKPDEKRGRLHFTFGYFF